jgi:hypothetical protein
MTWSPGTLRAKAEEKARRDAAESPVIDFGDASRATQGPGPLPPHVAAWPLHVRLDLTEQPDSEPPDPEDAYLENTYENLAKISRSRVSPSLWRKPTK